MKRNDCDSSRKLLGSLLLREMETVGIRELRRGLGEWTSVEGWRRYNRDGNF